MNLGIIYEKLGNGPKALAQYEDAVRDNPREPRILQNMGINMKRAGKFTDALNYYKCAIDLDPVNSIVLYNTGILHNIRSEYPQAISHLEKSIEHSKDNVYAYLALGDALERQKEHKKALKVYRELMSLGTKVHGLKERIVYLEGVIATEAKQQAAKNEREKEQARQLKMRAKEE